MATKGGSSDCRRTNTCEEWDLKPPVMLPTRSQRSQSSRRTQVHTCGPPPPQPLPECHALLPLLPVNAMPLRLLAKFRLPPSAVPPLAALRKPSRTAAGTYLFVHFAFLVLCVYKLSVCEWWANPGKSATQKKAEQQAKKAEKNEKAGTASRK